MATIIAFSPSTPIKSTDVNSNFNNLNSQTLQFANGADNGKQVQMGSVSITLNNGQNEYSVNVSFATAFVNTPRVVANLTSTQTTPASQFSGVAIISISVNGCNLYIRPLTTPGVNEVITLNWIAIG